MAVTNKQVKFSYGLLANYNGLSIKDPSTVYFITDKPYIYFNNVKYGIDATADIKAVKSITLGSDNKTLTIEYLDGSASSTIVLAEATQSKAGLMSAADKTKLDNLESALGNNLKYQSAMDDSLATVEKLGGIPAGTTAAKLKEKTLSEVFDDLLFPTVQPTYEAPTASLSLKSTSATPTIQEVGATGSTVPTSASFNTGFNKGAIKIAGVKKQDRAGNQTSAVLYYGGNVSNTTLPTSIAEGATQYRYRVNYAEGPVPLDSKGGNATNGSKLAAGYVESAIVTINGVYPYFARTSNSAFSKLALTTATTLSAVKMAAEGPNKHAFKLPAKYTLNKVELLNTLSGKYENFGTDKFDVTTENIEVQGAQVNYKVYTRNDSGFNGESTFNVTFSK